MSIFLNQRQHPVSGFSLIELMFALVVLVILGTIAAPNMYDMVVNSRVRAAASDLYGTLIAARSEAIKRNANVDIVPGTDWNGWRITVGGATLKQQDAYPATVVIAGPAGTVTYRRDGRLDGTANVNFTLSVRDRPDLKTRTVSVDLSGRPSVK
jgi:type IV fimbrial biogenesis protein FimT